MNDTTVTIQSLKDKVHAFVTEREWQQFHSPKNLSMAISIEAAELMEHFRFMSCQESKELVKTEKEAVSHEIADIIIACLAFANLYEIDIADVITKKLALNAQKYPVDSSKGSNKKYHHYQQKK